MCFKLRPSAGADGERFWRWTVYSYPDLLVLRDGEVAGDREDVERTARAAVAGLDGTLRLPTPR